jgi:hypothetical protein
MQRLLMDFFSTAGAVILDEKGAPSRKVGEGEAVVGILPDDLKRLYVALQEAEKALNEECGKVHGPMEAVLVKGPFAMSDADKDVLRQHTLAHNQQELLADIFWASVEKAFPQLAFPPMGKGLRVGWQVVSTPRRESRLHVIDLGMIPVPADLLEALKAELGS